jgi:predicted nucleic acid-binding protein
VGILIDSTVLVHAERQRRSPEDLVSGIIDQFGDVELAMSVMSAGELFHGCWRADTAVRRAQREEFVEAILAAIPTIPITLAVMRVFGQVDSQLSAKGERLPTSDMLIACTALLRDDEILTGNPRHFQRVPGLVVHDVK